MKLVKQKMKIKIGNKRLNEQSRVKFLGVLVDSTLSWKPYIVELTKKLTKTTGILYKLRHYSPKNLSIMLYNALIYPLFYGISSWGFTFSSNFDSLLAIQNKFLKIINPSMAKWVNAIPQEVFQIFLDNGKSFYSKQNF